MSLLPTCTVCDALLKGYGNNTRCARCKLPCPVCGGNVSQCTHPLERADLDPKEIGDGRFMVAA